MVIRKSIFPLLLIFFASACSIGEATTTPTTSALPDQITSPPPTTAPTPTEVVVLAALVNGEGIPESHYQASLLQFVIAQENFGTLLAPGEEASQRVIDDLIARLLLAQAGRAAGFSADIDMVNTQITQIMEESGGLANLNEWMDTYGYTLEILQEELAIEMEAAWQRDLIINNVPESAEQLKAQQVLFYDAFLAQRAHSQLEAGTSFETIVINNDPQNLGYLDWFPRGYLIYLALEEAAFALEPGNFTEVIQTEAGYHILYIYDRDPNHPLSPDARLTLQSQTLNEWLADQRSKSEIEIYTP